MLNLQANPDSNASGIILEAQMHKSKGILCSLLVQNGTLHKGDFLVVGSTYCRVKNIANDKLIELESAGPSMPVEVFGFDEMPNAGDRFVVTTERKAKAIAENYAEELKEKRIAQASRFGLNELILQSGKNIKELLLIIKADTQGSFESIAGSISKIITDEVIIKIIHSGAGAITESDVHLAEASNAIILGFNVRANVSAANAAERSKIRINYYNIIYNLLDDVKQIVSGMLSPIIREEFLGTAEIKQVFEISKIGKIAGSYVTKGVVKRNSKVRLLRDNVVIFEGMLKTLKRFKDDVREARENFECGIALSNYDDLQVGDIIESFDIIEEKRSL
jgi:translation initiation factor IF-2